MMLRKEQIDALLQAKCSPRVATAAERMWLKQYIAQQTGEHTKELVAKFDDLHIVVSEENEREISFTWSLKQRGVYELTDAYFMTMPKN